MQARRLLLLAAVASLAQGPAAAAAGAAAAGAAPVQPAFPYLPGGGGGGSWVPTFVDDFDGDALNTSLWRVRENETHCEPCELQLYVASALAVAGGELIVTTARERAVGPAGAVFNYTSGWVDSRDSFSQRFGLFEARARLPAQGASGAWPAFWTLPANASACWPTQGEIDVFEYLAADGLEDAVFGSFRWGTACGDDRQVLPGAAFPPAGQPPVDWAAAPHVFAALWNASAISFFVDGELYETKTAGEVILPSDAHYVILDTAVAPFWPPGPGAAYPATTAWDFVHVFTWSEAVTQ
jgi:beta-glucanase (GH16 family)